MGVCLDPLTFVMRAVYAEEEWTNKRGQENKNQRECKHYF